MPKDSARKPTKLDYLCVSNRWENMVINTETRWAPSIHRFGHKFCLFIPAAAAHHEKDIPAEVWANLTEAEAKEVLFVFLKKI